MSLVAYRETSAQLRRRLFNPPNAVKDEGIDLKRAPKPIVVDPTPADEQTKEALLHWRCLQFFNECVSANPSHPPIVLSNRTDHILKLVANTYKISINDLLSERRTANVVWPRQIAIWLTKTLTLQSLPAIGKRFGGRDHTTILHAVNKIERLRQADPELDAQLAQFIALLNPQEVT